jgi:hypothetical protein
MHDFGESLADYVLEIDGRLPPGDESQSVEILGGAWARLVELARGKARMFAEGLNNVEVTTLQSTEAVPHSAKQVLLLLKDSGEGVILSDGDALALSMILRHVADMGTICNALSARNSPVETAQKAARDVADALPAGAQQQLVEAFDPVPPPKKKRERKPKAAAVREHGILGADVEMQIESPTRPGQLEGDEVAHG